MLQHEGAQLKFLVLLPIHGPTTNRGFSFFIFTHDKAPKASRHFNLEAEAAEQQYDQEGWCERLRSSRLSMRSVRVRRSKIRGGGVGAKAPQSPPVLLPLPGGKNLQTPDMGKLLHFMVFACLCLTQINTICGLTQNLIISIAFHLYIYDVHSKQQSLLSSVWQTCMYDFQYWQIAPNYGIRLLLFH